MQIRPATFADATAISALIFDVKHFFTIDPSGAGAERFLATINAQDIADKIGADNFEFFVGVEDEQVAGIVALRDNKHLFYLFVAAPFQRKGFAEQLWEHARTQAANAGNPGEFTVNSTPFAVPVYEKFGFEIVGQRTEVDGIAFVPMRRTA